ncbi:Lsm14a protein, partial [Aphelenchoides avenae]
DKLKFDSDYDFEKANEQFQETLEKITDGVDKVTVSDSGIAVEKDNRAEAESPDSESQSATEKAAYYDKKSSFFDTISCEALEKEEGKNNRPDWRKERKTNQETFGDTAVRSMNYRRGGRGYGGRGGPRGGPQRYGDNNGGFRSYNNYNNSSSQQGASRPTFQPNRRPFRQDAFN